MPRLESDAMPSAAAHRGTDSAAIAFAGVSVAAWDARAAATRELLHGVDWHVERGEHWAILGPNGAGKTTVLLAARRLARVTRGAITVLGLPLSAPGLADPLNRVGVIEATPPRLAQRASALDAVLTHTSASAALRGRRVRAEDRDRAASLLAGFGCGELGDRRYADCSRGERQRIQLAHALMRGPSLLLFDEPTTGLDLPGREAFLEAVDRLALEQPEVTTVTVTHHLEEIPSSATHALLLRGGGVVAAGPIAEVISDDRLADCFGVGISVSRAGGRWAARLQAAW